jgi:hypothetical protein
MNVPVALHEFARVLRPGGRLWLVLHPLSMVDWSHALRRVRLLAYECYRLGNTVALAWGLPLMAWPARVRRYESYQTDGGIRRALARSGFDNIVISRSQHYVVTCAKR